ncbi:MAG: beta-N-acetylhexosaminidase [Candidatus Spyradosoma sp.]
MDDLEIFPKDTVSAFAERGFMLDVSRGRVPTMPALEKLVRLLAALRYNRLQLYVEHTFAFRGHEEVWRDASPLTPEEIRRLDAFCRAHGIELVPNLNSFGHVERWLKHARYRPLAECPDGFYHELFKMRRAAGTFAPGEASADFMGGLYREYLPNFSSEFFNVGGDEPWELGQGRSRGLCAARGRRAVYLEHMARLKKRAEACGKKIMFWADVLLGDDGEIPADFVRGTVPVIWGYEADHPFDAQCARVRGALAAAGGDPGGFLVAPGTSSWLSFGTRQTNALANVRAACAAAKKYGARGVLLTTWGDFGYHNPPAADLAPLVACAAEMWGGFREGDVRDALKAFFPGEESFAEALLEFGRLDDFFAKKITNRSLIRELFFARDEAFAKLMDGVSADEVAAAKNVCARVLSSAERSRADCGGFRVAAEMAFAALRRAEAFLKNDADARAAVEAEMSGPLRERFAAAWRLFDREGGLAESLSYFS